jgi:hypothetical protein
MSAHEDDSIRLRPTVRRSACRSDYSHPVIALAYGDTIVSGPWWFREELPDEPEARRFHRATR